MLHFKNIGLFTSSANSEKIFIARQIEEILKNKGCRVLFDSSFQIKKTKNKIKTFSSNYLSRNCDLVIAIGGDGTMLSCLRQYGSKEIPILGINLGSVGFLTDIKVENFHTSMQEILDGNYKIEERNLVSAKFNDNHLYGLNEVVIHSGAYAQLMRYRLNVNDKVVYEQRSDGLIIATPTGSTAYSLSAGGPIIHPSLDVWTIIPMLPQSISSRPFVISSNEKVEMELFEGPSENAKICVDGQKDIDVPYGLNISISKTKKTLKLVHPKDNDFFEACREKLGWSLNLSKK